MNIKELVEKGVERNIVVYDCQSKGYISVRLIALMRLVSRKNESGHLKKVLMSEHAKSEVGYTLKEYEDLGVKIEFVLNPTEYFYVDKDCALPMDKENIVVGLCEDGNVLLGAY